MKNLKFKKIELADIKAIKRYTHNSEIIACEKNVTNLVIWQRAYNNMFAISDGILFLKSGKEKTQSFSIPIGADVKKGFEKIFAYTAPEEPRFWLQDRGDPCL